MGARRGDGEVGMSEKVWQKMRVLVPVAAHARVPAEGAAEAVSWLRDRLRTLTLASFHRHQLSDSAWPTKLVADPTTHTSGGIITAAEPL